MNKMDYTTENYLDVVSRSSGMAKDCFWFETKSTGRCTAHPLQWYQDCPSGYYYFHDEWKACGFLYWGGMITCNRLRLTKDSHNRKECNYVHDKDYNHSITFHGRRLNEEASDVASRLGNLIVNPADLGAPPPAVDA